MQLPLEAPGQCPREPRTLRREDVMQSLTPDRLTERSGSAGGTWDISG